MLSEPWKLFLVLVAYFSTQSYCWMCGGAQDYIQFTNPPVYYTRDIDRLPIRIKYFPTNFDLGDSSSNLNFTNSILNLVNSYFPSFISINRVQSPLMFPGVTNCGPEILIPDSHATIGIADADLVVYITTSSNPNVNYIAYGGACIIDPANSNQVLAGKIVINVPTYKTIDFDKTSMFAVIVHEMWHILGFSNGLFPYWKNNNGVAYAPGTQTAVFTIAGITKTYLTTPNVLKEVRESFNCSTLQGLALEEQGPSGIVNSHIDEFFHYGDLLNCVVHGDPIFSKYMMSILIDIGWYNVDKTYGQTAIWFKNAGCEALTKRCIKNEGSTAPDKFCVGINPGCDPYRTFKSRCNTWNYNSNCPLGYQYYLDLTKGGSDIYLDYCTYHKPTSNGGCYGGSQITSIVTEYGEIMGPDSRCFTSTLIVLPYDNLYLYAACYKVTQCTPQGTIVQIGNSFVLCPIAGGQISVPGYVGYLFCPSSSELCGDKPCWHGCYGRGKCIQGKCVCKDGYSGADCSIECHSSCLSCLGPNATQCVVCVDPAKIPTGPECKCRPGYLTLSTGECQAIVSCEKLCSICSLVSNINVCTQCVANSTALNGFCECNTGFRQVGNQCPNCINGYYLSGTTCIPCVYPCYTCTSSTFCTSCVNDYILANNRCISTAACAIFDTQGYCIECFPGYYLNQGKCIPCNPPCNNCTSLTTCTSCLGSYNLINTMCNCPDNCKTCDIKSYVCAECNVGYYVNLGRCTKCQQQCKTCNKANSCTSCYGNYTLNSDSQCACPQGCKTCDEINYKCLECTNGYYLKTGVCVKCIEPCATCNATTCFSCLGIYNLTAGNCSCPSTCAYCDLKTWTCLVCNNGYYLNDGSCIACIKPCANCISSSICTSCIQPFLLNSDSQCICPPFCKLCDSLGCIKCYDGYFNANSSCYQCVQPCKTCSVTATNCTSCLGHYVKNSTSCSCPSCCQCDANSLLCSKSNDGHFLTNIGCSPCSQPCATCRDSSLLCTKCLGSLILAGTQCTLPPGCIKFDPVTWKCTLCDNQYILNVTSGTCTSCTPPCRTCQSSANICQTCLDTYILVVSECKCPLNCATCGTNPYVCLACNPGWIVIAGRCEKCDSNCKTCSILPSNCLSCNGTLALVNGQCLCPSNCKTCNTTTWNCSVCHDTYYLSLGACFDCTAPCKTCIGSATTCTSCLGNYYLENGICKSPLNCKTLDTVKYICKECNDKYYLTYGNCAPCTPPCNNCTGSSTSCLSCLGKYALVGNQCLCPSSCLSCETGPSYNCTNCIDGYWKSNGECLACDKNCKKCTTSSTVCSECYGVYVLNGTSCQCPLGCKICDTTTFKCLTCNNGFYYSNNNCLPCHISCNTCSASAITCTSCKGVFVMNGNQCVCPSYCNTCDNSKYNCTKCADGWLMVNGVCNSCSPPCKTCNVGTSNCRSCLGTYFYGLSNNIGTCNCPKSCLICDPKLFTCTKCANEFYFNNGNCFSCLKPCKNCLTGSVCTSCVNNYDFDPITGKCNCPINCAKCDDINLLCTQCKDGFFLNNGVCNPCEASCKTCVTNAITCTSCFREDELNARSQCCSLGCSNCFLGSTKCSECADKYYNSNRECIRCQDPCISCTSQAFCTKCSGYLILDAAKGTCSCPTSCISCDSAGQCTSCLNGFYVNAGKCDACVSPCKTCVASNFCLTCVDYKGITATGTCTACPSKCITCDNTKNVCYSCVSPAVLSSGTCK